MKIKMHNHDYAVDVFALYWVNDIRHCLVIPYKGFNGLLLVTDEEFQVMDWSLHNFVIRESGQGGDILVHWAASRDDLLDLLIDYEPGAVAELERRLREETPPPVPLVEMPPPLPPMK